MVECVYEMPIYRGDYIQFDAVLCRSKDKSLASKSLRAFIDINTINHAGGGIV